MNWFWLLLRRGPHEAFDWLDDRGAIDHGKAAADCVVFVLTAVVAYVAIVHQAFPPVAWGIILIAGAMGSRVFIAFLRSRTVTSHEELTPDAPIQRDMDDPDQMAGTGNGGDRAAQ